MYPATAMPADLCAGAQIPPHRRTAVLTPKGYVVLALIHEQDALDLADVAGRERLDQAISELLDID